MTLYVNGEKVEQALIDYEIQRLRPDYERVFSDQSQPDREKQLTEWARENIIEMVVFQQEARNEFADIDKAAVQRALDGLLAQEGEDGPVHQQLNAGADQAALLHSQIADQIRRDQLTQKITAHLREPTDKAVQKHYQQNTDRFTIPETAHAAHIVKHPGPETSPEQMRQLNSGTPFEELASKNSDCPESAGDLGFFARGKMVPAFEEVVFNLEPGDCPWF